MSAAKPLDKTKRTMAPSRKPTAGSKRVSMTETAYLKIRSQILENELPAGFQITEQELAERLAISRTPTREALLRLQSEGLIEIWPRHGMRVKHISAEDVREIYDIITVLEARAARLAASQKISKSKLDRMRECISQMDAALADDDLRGWAEADRKFHLALVEASGNERLAEIVSTLTGQAHRLRMITLPLRPRPTGSNRDHAAVVEAITKGDAEAAERIHLRHREESGAMLIKLLTTHGINSL